MSKARRHPQLSRHVAQLHADPLTIGARARTNVHDDIVDLTRHHAHQLALRVLGLKMKTSQHPRLGVGDVVLDKRSDTELGPPIPIPVTDKATAMVIEVLQLQHQDVRNVSRDHVHTIHAYLALQLLSNRSMR